MPNRPAFPLCIWKRRYTHAILSVTVLWWSHSVIHAERAVNLLRTHFLGFLGDVLVDDEEEDLADFLATEGVLSREHLGSLTYRMTSHLVDG